MKRQNEIKIDVLDLLILRDGWSQMLSRLCSSDGAACGCEECGDLDVDHCLERLGEIQRAIREAENDAATLETHAANASKRPN